MSDEARAATLDRLAAVWARWPQQRLGQLIANAVAETRLLRVLPDDVLLTQLEDFYVNREGAS